MDGDLQHDPAEIPKFVAKLNEGYDIVSGWREKRIDNLCLRRIPSRCANWVMSKLSGVDLQDFGTTYKAYTRELIDDIPLYGEGLHRFFPALASWYGAKICEVPIVNIDREGGTSHYGISRTIRVFFDSITIRFLLKYMMRPLHFFGNLRPAQPVGRQRGCGMAGSRKVSASCSRHGLSRPADDAGARPAARRIESARHRTAGRDASAPLPTLDRRRQFVDRAAQNEQQFQDSKQRCRVVALEVVPDPESGTVRTRRFSGVAITATMNTNWNSPDYVAGHRGRLRGLEQGAEGHGKAIIDLTIAIRSSISPQT